MRFSQLSRTKSLQLKVYSLNKNISFVDQIKNYFMDLVVTETNKSISKEIYQEITLGPDQNINLWIVEYQATVMYLFTLGNKYIKCY